MMFDHDFMTNGMIWGMGFFWLLGATVLLLTIAALAKYVFGGSRG